MVTITFEVTNKAAEIINTALYREYLFTTDLNELVKTLVIEEVRKIIKKEQHE